ncbi:MAG: TGS domain-containing protein, partial [bacterium]
QRYRQANTDPERLDALQEMLKVIPKHKGTEKLQAEIKAKIAKLKKSSVGKKGGSRQKQLDNIPKDGAAQIPLLGGPNCGKSQFLATVTNATPEVAEYPFSTRTPTAGMMPWENVQFQLIDLPPVALASYEGWMKSLIFRADAILLFADLGSDDILDDLETVVNMMEAQQIHLVKPDFDPEDEDLSLEAVWKPTLLVANRCDLDEDSIRYGFLAEHFGDRFSIYRVNSKTGWGTESLKANLFASLRLVRIYTKMPGHEPDLADPVLLTPPATVKDAAIHIHKDFAHKLKYARIWGEGKHEGQRVNEDFEIADGDVLEFHL